jgi:hypothetical protein
MDPDDKVIRKEETAIHRTRCAVSGVIEGLKIMGFYQMAQDATGRLKPLKLDPQQRRELLIYLSELEELVSVLEKFKSDLARSIEQAGRGLNAASAYHRTGAILKKNARAH